MSYKKIKNLLKTFINEHHYDTTRNFLDTNHTFSGTDSAAFDKGTGLLVTSDI